MSAHANTSTATASLHAQLLQRLQILTPITLNLIDESHLHAGHAGARGGARHFRLQIVSKQFHGLSTLARHRLVYDCVRDLMPHPVHALAIEANTPSTEGLS